MYAAACRETLSPRVLTRLRQSPSYRREAKAAIAEELEDLGRRGAVLEMEWAGGDAVFWNRTTAQRAVAGA